jgi:hypothetical protein
MPMCTGLQDLLVPERRLPAGARRPDLGLGAPTGSGNGRHNSLS